MLAHYHGQIGNASEISRSLSESPQTVKRHLDLLTGSFMVRQLQPWVENLGKRQVKSPKVYLRDSGLLHAFLGVPSFRALEGHPKLGASWEGFVIEEVLHAVGERNAFFWSTQAGAELDLLVILNGKRYGVEVKYADAPGMTKSMHIALHDLKLKHLFVAYPGGAILSAAQEGDGGAGQRNSHGSTAILTEPPLPHPLGPRLPSSGSSAPPTPPCRSPVFCRQ